MVNCLLCATGSVAAIKLYKLHDELLKALPSGSEIKTVVTKAAKHFVDNGGELVPIEGQREEEGSSAEGKKYKDKIPLLTDEDEWEKWHKRGDPVEHVDLRKWADVIVVAPLDANTLAKITNGLCDNLVTCIIRAWQWSTKPAIFAPAMNTSMWEEHPLTKKQIETLQSFSSPALVRIVGPISKKLMCKDVGMGAMSNIPDIVSVVLEALASCSSSSSSSSSSASASATTAASGSEVKKSEASAN